MCFLLTSYMSYYLLRTAPERKNEIFPIGLMKYCRAQTVWYCMGAQGTLRCTLSSPDSLLTV